jgi:AcrR family transcriptional regulator
VVVPLDSDLRWVRPPQQARSQETLDRILAAAAALVAAKGYEDTPVSEIVARAGSSVGAFYARFPDKHALLHALSNRFVEEGMATADATLDPRRWEGVAVAEVVASVVRFLVSVYREQGGLIRAFVIQNHTDLEFRERQDRLSTYVTDRVSELLLARIGEIRVPDPERAIRFGLTVVFCTLENVMLFGELRSNWLTLSDEEFAAELTRVYLASLGVSYTNDRIKESP